MEKQSFRFGFLILSLCLAPAGKAWADECPIGKIVKTEGVVEDLEFRWRMNSTDKQCRILNPQVFRVRGGKVVGCSESDGVQKYMIEPRGTVVTDCFTFQPQRLVFPADRFYVELPPAAHGAPIPPKRKSSGPGAISVAEQKRLDAIEAWNGGDNIATAIDDSNNENTGAKTSEGIYKFHSCLLSEDGTEQTQKKKYLENYRALISYANREFQVPISLLTCTCGRESRFEAGARNPGGAAGICQATGPFIDEINSFIAKPGPLRDQWKAYLISTQGRGEPEDCRALNADGSPLPLTKARVVRCPSLGLGSAAMYLRHIFARLEGKRHVMTIEDWQKQNVASFVAASGAFNVGVSFADSVLNGVDRSHWPEVLLTRTCQSWRVTSANPAERKKQLQRAQDKFYELRGHLIALRNCLQKDNYLNHQGEPLGGECADLKISQQSQLASFKAFDESLPAGCDMGRITKAPALRSAEVLEKTGRD